ncbi:MAG TPA: hypothetical protein VGM77_07325 [Gemmatimonadales bacterium]|jgi:high-affinity nickel-transport protein
MNTSLWAIAALGFVLGMRHATDPDHVVAVTTIVARQHSTRRAAAIGAMWGVGHTLTILLVGGGIILFQWVIPTRLGLSMEFSVALMLIFLGILNLRDMKSWLASLRAKGTAAEAHAHGPHDHQHGDEPGLLFLDQHLGRAPIYQLVRPLLIGIVHGLAGSAAVALLVLATIHDPRWGMLYLLVFGLGTVVGMMLITSVIAVPFAVAGKRRASLHRTLRLASGAISLLFGLYVAWRIGIVGGLFTSHPSWTPS